MKVYEGIALGRTMLKHIPGNFLDTSLEEATRGCALGMVMKAANANTLSMHNFPMLFREIPSYPCGCKIEGTVHPLMCLVITHINDMHIFGVGDWTLDQLIDWVAQAEKQFDAAQATKTVVEAVKQEEPVTEAVAV